MRRLHLLVILGILAFVVTPATAQEDGDDYDEGIYGYTSLDVTSSSTLVGYSQTDLDSSLSFYYSAKVIATLSTGGVLVAQATDGGQDGGDTASVTINYSSATPNTTYNLVGHHQAWLSITDPCEGCQYEDYYDYEFYASLGIMAIDQYDYEPQGSPQSGPESIPLGSTYDNAQATTAGKCNDQRDQIIAEYVTYHVGYAPMCATFTQTASTTHFSFAELNTGNYSWAILQSYFLSGIETVRTDNGNVALTVNSAYRNPAKQALINPDAPNSRHAFGDAVDFNSNSTTWQGLYSAGKRAGGCVEPISSQGGSYAHCHIDFRGACPSKW